MKRWSIRLCMAIAAAAAIGGCASRPASYELGTRDTYYEPVYAGSRYGYNNRHGTDFAFRYGFSSAYYPWWSVDYFYLGQHHYRPSYWWRYGHYSPWHPWYYQPWASRYAWSWPYRPYDPWYRYGGYDPYWYWRFRQHDVRPPARDTTPEPAGSHGGQYAGGYRPGIEDNLRGRERMARGGAGSSDRPDPPRSRSAVVAPVGDREQGTVIVGGGENKVGRSRAQPVRDIGAPPATRPSPQPSVTVPPPRNTPPRPNAAPASPPRVTAPPTTRSFPARRQNPPVRGPARVPQPGGSLEDDGGRPGPARFRDRD